MDYCGSLSCYGGTAGVCSNGGIAPSSSGMSVTCQTGSETCTDCVSGKYSTSVGAAADSTCMSCPSNSDSLAGSSALAACDCGQSKYLAVVGATGDTSCEPCPSHSSSPPGSESCTCNEIFRLDASGTCVEDMCLHKRALAEYSRVFSVPAEVCFCQISFSLSQFRASVLSL